MFARSASRSKSRTARSGSAASAESVKSKSRTKLGRGSLWDSTDKAPELRVKKPKTVRRRKRLEVCVGAKVDCHGLVSAAQYNGSQGHVVSGPNEKGRWDVQLDFHHPVKTLSLLAANLQPKPTCGWEVVSAGLTIRTDDSDVKDIFQRFGELRTCKLTRDSDGVSKQVALIEFCRKADAEKAIDELNDHVVDHNAMKVQWSTMAKQEMGLLKLKGEASDHESSDDGEADAPRRTFQEKEAVPRPAFQNLPKTQSFEFGAEVVLKGLKGAAQYNGLTARVEGIAADGRYEVLLMKAGGTMKTIAVKPQNLDPAKSAEEVSRSTPAEAVPPDAAPAEAIPAESAPAEPARPPEAAETRGDCDRSRKRRSAWGDADSMVYVGAVPHKTPNSECDKNQLAPDDSSSALPALPATTSELEALTTKELKRLLAAYEVNTADCFDKPALLEKGLALISD